MTFLSKLFTTHITLKVFIFCMYLLMSVKDIWLRKFLSANITFKWFFTSMTSLMSYKMMFVFKWLFKISHWKGFSPVCVLSCVSKLPLRLKILEQMWHLNLFSDVISSILVNVVKLYLKYNKIWRNENTKENYKSIKMWKKIIFFKNMGNTNLQISVTQGSC